MSAHCPGPIVGWLGSIAATLTRHLTESEDAAELLLLKMLQAALENEPAP